MKQYNEWYCACTVILAEPFRVGYSYAIAEIPERPGAIYQLAEGSTIGRRVKHSAKSCPDCGCTKAEAASE